MTQADSELGELGASPRLLRAGVLLLVGLAYLPTLRFGFVYDDGWVILSNGFLRQPDWSVLLSPLAVEQHVPDAFRPVSVAFDVLVYRLFGLLAPLHHALSLLLHLAVCRLLWDLCERLHAPVAVCVSTTLLFGLMAIHAEAVTVVSFREDLLAALLGLGALVLALRVETLERPAARIGALVTAALLMALACGAKASAAPLPFLFLLLVLGDPFGRGHAGTRSWLAFGVLLAGVGLWLAETSWVFGSPFPYGEHNPRIMAQRVGTGPVLAASVSIHAQYLQQMLVPVGLQPEYVDTPGRFGDPATVLSGLGLVGLFGYGMWAGVLGRRPVMAVAILGWFVLALPTSNAFGMPNMQAERFMYLPSVPVALGMGLVCTQLGRTIRRRAERDDPLAVLVPALIWGVLQGSAAYAETTAYASNATLWKTAVARTPGSARATALRGLHMLANSGDRVRTDPVLAARIQGLCEAAHHHDPRYELPEVCMGRLRVAQRRWPEAALHFDRALKVSPDRNDRILAALVELGPDLSDRATERAHEILDRALSAYPFSPELHAAGGRLHHKLGHPERAMALYRRARSLRPERWETVVAALELALDLGDAPAAQRTWLEERKLLIKADPPVRAALARRMASARQREDLSLLQSLFSPGVF